VSTESPVEGLRVLAPVPKNYAAILTPEALDFLEDLIRRFSTRREELLELRIRRQARIDAGELPAFPPETKQIRNSDWQIAPEPADLQKRIVEITGPAGDRKMVINALNSGADTYMADFEDSQSPTWDNTIQGQINVGDAINGTISYTSPEGKRYRLNSKTAVLIVRPRGWHLLEKHVLVDGSPVSASIFDFSLNFFHNARKLVSKKSGPYFYLPKIESYLEARLWNDIFDFSEVKLGLDAGVTKATVLIETILAGFEMDEILYELRDHSAGLNCGRWDYIFSFIKKFRGSPDMVLPDRAQVTMDKAFLRAYVDLSIKTCHRRNAHSIGGMSAYIPVKDEKANQIALQSVRADKEREVGAGHDGTWVAHPGLVPLASEVFSLIGGPHQMTNKREDVLVKPAHLLQVPQGEITEGGVRTNASVGIRYLEAWLRGKGSVPINNLMEDAATAEICRAQLWQWMHHGTKLKDGRTINESLFRGLLNSELEMIKSQVGEAAFRAGEFELARRLFENIVTSNQFVEFLTLPAYEELLGLEKDDHHQLPAA
jgi:malate synthase